MLFHGVTITVSAIPDSDCEGRVVSVFKHRLQLIKPVHCVYVPIARVYSSILAIGQSYSWYCFQTLVHKYFQRPVRNIDI